MNLTVNEVNINTNIQDGFITIITVVLIIGIITFTYFKKFPAK
jgi:hypothetical protein